MPLNPKHIQTFSYYQVKSCSLTIVCCIKNSVVIDVGQGDSTLIVTPKNKTILIDGGGSRDYNIGKNTLLPYLLDRGYSSIDYMIISHFDNDHIGGLLYVIQEIRVKNIIIGKQYEESENYKKFAKIVKEKNIKVKTVEAAQKINIERNLYFNVLWPSR